jgi:hypothetical protein
LGEVIERRLAGIFDGHARRLGGFAKESIAVQPCV